MLIPELICSIYVFMQMLNPELILHIAVSITFFMYVIITL